MLSNEARFLDVRKAVMNNWLVNPTGHHRGFIPVDLMQEHNNFWTKVRRHQGPVDLWLESDSLIARLQGSRQQRFMDMAEDHFTLHLLTAKHRHSDECSLWRQPRNQAPRSGATA